MARFGSDDDLTGAEFHQVVATGSSLRRVRFTDSTFREVDFAGSAFYDVGFGGATLREVWFGGARLIGASFEDAVIDGDVDGLVINGVEVGPLVEAELDRRHPGREQLRSSDPDELRAAWAWLEGLWAQTSAAALRHPEASLRLRVDDEWSFLETLRHLLFATDSWLGAGILGRTSYHPWGLAGPWLDPTTCGLDVDATPTVEEVLAARAEQQALVRDYLATVTPESLGAVSVPAESVGWPTPDPMPVLARLHVILNEEWWHRQFAMRDMAQWP